MFEKEAEEYQTEKRKSFSEHEQLCWGDVYKDWKNGAEFGYNKANEWHYVKDELPDEGTYLVVWQNDNGYKEIFIMNYEEDDEEEFHWVDGDCEVHDEYVIAWKEIPQFKE